MDYFGWELERQRSALAALLLGGGEIEAVRDEQRRSPEGPEAAGHAVMGTAGRYAGASGEAGSFDTAAFEAGEAVREAVRLPERTLRAADVRGSGEALERRGLDDGARILRGLRRAAQEEIPPPLSGGTGVQGTESSGSGRAWPEGQEPASGSLAETGRTVPEGTYAGEQPARGGGDAASPAAELPERADAGEGWSFRRSRGIQAGSSTGVQTGSQAEGESLLLRSGTVFPVDGGIPAETAGAYGLPVSRPAWGGRGTADLQADTDARSLSRAVQRDARRYDGGFILY